MQRSRKLLLLAIGILAAMQLVPIGRTNPPISGDIETPPGVKEVLRRSCYDCHSNETHWPWYARVAPMSWLVHRDVVEGRRHLNFSEWDKVAANRRQRRQAACGREVRSGDMPLWFYLPLHPAAKLAEQDKALLERWASSAATAATPPASADAKPAANPQPAP